MYCRSASWPVLGIVLLFGVAVQKDELDQGFHHSYGTLSRLAAGLREISLPLSDLSFVIVEPGE